MLKPLHVHNAPALRIRSERVLLPDGVSSAVLEVEHGIIRNIRPHSSGCDVDVSDSLLMPAIVDTHVHVNEPGREDWEGWKTATQAAAHGGVAVLADMPLNSMPVTTSVQALEEKIHSTTGKLWVDCALWGGVVPGNTGELSGMVDRGVAGFKAFLCHSGIDEFPAVEREDLLRAMPELKAQGVPLLFHAELEADEPIDVRHHSVREYVRWLHARPREWEDRAVAMVIELVEQTGCPAHIVHLSSATALPMLRRAKQAGLPITVETCPHYLCLTAEDVPDGATQYKCAPPIRGQDNREALWKGLKDGVIDQVVTDHSPCIPSLKHLDVGDFEAAWGGIASLELGLSSVWTEARRRGFNIQHLSRWMSATPAQLLGCSHSMGVIQPGARADLVAWKPDAQRVVTAEGLHQRHSLTPYLGQTQYGVVEHTWLRGHPVLQSGTCSSSSCGSVLLRKKS